MILQFPPDGRTLVYSDRRGVYSMPARGGRARLIAPERDAYALGASPAPDDVVPAPLASVEAGMIPDGEL